jgi:hypothetical protein
MDKTLILLSIAVVALGLTSVIFPDAAGTVMLTLPLTLAALFIFRWSTDEKEFITKIFLVGLFVRVGFGLFVHIFNYREFFGGDALTYDAGGANLVNYWLGNPISNDPFTQRAMSTSTSGWGMNYIVGFLYVLVGRNILAAQTFCGVVGAATAPMVYLCAKKLFENKRVAKFSAIAIALFPSFIIWSSQLLKDGLIVFLLVLIMTMVLQLHERINYFALVALIIGLFGILSLRFYIFYMVGIAVTGSFLIGVTNSASSIVRRAAVLVLIGIGLTYFGAPKTATTDFERYGNLEQLQSSRSDLAQSGGSGFGEDADVSTTRGAISVLPLGFAYLMLAPFPWQVTSMRQAITLPEVLLWWAMMPLLVYGIWYTVRHRLRTAFPVLFFSLLLTLAYSIFQGNVGTAYRQRTQIQVFLFMFIGVGYTLYRERKEDKKILQRARQQRLDSALRARMRQDV